MPIELDIIKEQKVKAKELQMHCKVSDRFTASLVDDSGNEICEQGDGYVPGFMPGQHYGDYVILNIDIETGQITNWNKPEADELKEWVDKCNGHNED
jgi:hypothetical protein